MYEDFVLEYFKALREEILTRQSARARLWTFKIVILVITASVYVYFKDLKPVEAGQIPEDVWRWTLAFAPLFAIAIDSYMLVSKENTMNIANYLREVESAMQRARPSDLPEIPFYETYWVEQAPLKLTDFSEQIKTLLTFYGPTLFILLVSLCANFDKIYKPGFHLFDKLFYRFSQCGFATEEFDTFKQYGVETVICMATVLVFSGFAWFLSLHYMVFYKKSKWWILGIYLPVIALIITLALTSCDWVDMGFYACFCFFSVVTLWTTDFKRGKVGLFEWVKKIFKRT